MRAPEFWTGTTAGAQFCSAMLAPVGAVYGYSVRLRQQRSRPWRPRARVLCVGNLTAGGTGKTPVAIAVSRLLAAHGRTLFLTRGYGGRLAGPIVVDPNHHSVADVGDEALLLARFGRTIVSGDRAAGAQIADKLAARFIVMDDGFQNFRITKDLALVVVDAETGFGNGRLIPAGPLREPVTSGLARADAVIMVGKGTVALPFGGPILRAMLVPDSPDIFHGRKLLAFAGIGRPQKFFDMLSAYGAQLAGTIAFPDHHRFGQSEIAGLVAQSRRADALLVTTEKDYMRLGPAMRGGITPIRVSLQFDDPAQIQSVLESLTGIVVHGG